MGERESIEELSSASLRAVAARLARATSFIDLVYCESDLDALFSLADIAITSSRTAPGRSQTDHGTIDEIARVRDLVFDAHDHAHDENLTLAISQLERAASILERLETVTEHDRASYGGDAPDSTYND